MKLRAWGFCGAGAGQVEGTDEGGVAAGFAVLDSPLLV